MARMLKRWKRVRVTTNLSGENSAALEEVSGEMNLPLGRVVDQALDEYFDKIGARKERSAPPYDSEHLKEVGERVRQRIERRLAETSEGAKEE